MDSCLNQDLRRLIVETFLEFKPRQIIVFGSHARGDADRYSDIDLIIVYETEKHFMDRLAELYLAWNIPKAVDILAYTPDEYCSLKETSVFVQEILKEGEVIYEET